MTAGHQTIRRSMPHLLHDLFHQEVPNVSRQIAPADGMLEGNRDHYFRVGHSALRCVRLAMLAAGRSGFDSILDFGCGYGRVLRTLRAAFPEARLTACDLLREGVDFCAREFAATPVYATREPERMPIEGAFDLIWCGTVLTNLRSSVWTGLLNLFQSILAPGGILVFTTHGRWVVERMRNRVSNYGLEEEVINGLLADYDRHGFGYRDYPPAVLRLAKIEGDYGISLSSPAWICTQVEKLPDLRLLCCAERFWDNHQDMVACLREMPEAQTTHPRDTP